MNYTIQSNKPSIVNVYFTNENADYYPKAFTTQSLVRRLALYINDEEVENFELNSDIEYSGYYPMVLQYYKKDKKKCEEYSHDGNGITIM